MCAHKSANKRVQIVVTPFPIDVARRRRRACHMPTPMLSLPRHGVHVLSFASDRSPFINASKSDH